MAGETLEAKVVRFEGNEQRFNTLVNGGPDDTWSSTGGTELPSVQKFFADTEALYDNAVLVADHAEMVARLPNIADGSVVEVQKDETVADSRTRYKVEGGVATFLVNVDRWVDVVKRASLTYPDYAAASAAAATLPDGQVVLAPSVGGRLVRFTAQSGSLVFYDFVADVIRLTSATELRAYSGSATSADVELFGVIGRFAIDPSDTVSADDGVLTLVGANGARWKRNLAGLTELSAVMFGVVESTTIDSTDAIRLLFQTANALSKPVTYVGLRNVAVQDGVDIKIKVPVDFAGCKHHAIATAASTKRVYHVIDDAEPFVVTPSNPAALTRGTQQITFAENLPAGFLFLNTSIQVNPRWTAGGVRTNKFYRQCFLLGRDGVLHKPLEYNLAAKSPSEYTFTLTPFPAAGWIEIAGLVVDDVSFTGVEAMLVQRSMTTVNGVKIAADPTSVAAGSVSTVFSAKECGAIRLKNIESAARKTDGGIANYAYNIVHCADVVMDDCGGIGDATTWGATLINYSDIVANRCRFNRFDSHEGLFHWTLNDCEVFEGAVQWGFGYGYLKINNITYYKPTRLLNARNDYGGDFDGIIEVDGVDVYVSDAASTLDIYHGPIGSTDFPVNIARSLSVENVTLRYSGATPLKVFHMNTYTNALIPAGQTNLGYHKPDVIDFKGFRNIGTGDVVLGGNGVIRFAKAPLSGKGLCRWTFDNIDCLGVSGTHYLINSNATRASYGVDLGSDIIKVRNCRDVLIQCAKPNIIWRISDINIFRGLATWRGASSLSTAYINDVVIDLTVAIPDMSVSQGEIGTGCSEAILSNVTVRTNCDMTNASALSGVSVLTEVTATLPAGVTYTQASEGWRSSAKYQ